MGGSNARVRCSPVPPGRDSASTSRPKARRRCGNSPPRRCRTNRVRAVMTRRHRGPSRRRHPQGCQSGAGRSDCARHPRSRRVSQVVARFDDRTSAARDTDSGPRRSASRCGPTRRTRRPVAAGETDSGRDRLQRSRQLRAEMRLRPRTRDWRVDADGACRHAGCDPSTMAFVRRRPQRGERIARAHSSNSSRVACPRTADQKESAPQKSWSPSDDPRTRLPRSPANTTCSSSCSEPSVTPATRHIVPAIAYRVLCLAHVPVLAVPPPGHPASPISGHEDGGP